jgi:hypothetical protein
MRVEHVHEAAIVALGATAVLGCARGSGSSKSVDSSDASRPDAGTSCANVLRVGVGVRGTYSFAGYLGTAPQLNLTDLGPGPSLFAFPELPAVTVPAGDMCTARFEHGDLDVACVDGPGSVRSVVASRLELAKGFRVDPACLQIEDHVGVHDVQAVAQAWAEATRGCDVDGGTRRRVRFSIEVPAPLPPKERGGFHVVWPRLRAPALGVSIELGSIMHEGSCYARRFETPRGVGYACSDEDIELAAAYQVGRTIFYRTASPQLSTFTLPCGIDADFDVHSSEQLSWE